MLQLQSLLLVMFGTVALQSQKRIVEVSVHLPPL